MSQRALTAKDIDRIGGLARICEADWASETVHPRGRYLRRADVLEALARPPAAPEGVRLTDARIEAMLDAFADAAGKAAIGVLQKVAHGSPDHAGFNRAYEVVRAALAAAEQTDTAPPDASGRSSADWRRLTGLWRYGVTVCPPTCADFYNWLGVLDAAIDERTSRPA